MKARRQLVIDTSYSLEIIRKRGLEQTVTCRDLDGYFDHVWTVHPFATHVTSEQWTVRWGMPESHELAPAHTFIEAKIGRFRCLRQFPRINFLLGQASLLRWLRRLVRAQHITVLRANGPLYSGLLGWMISRLCGIPLVIRIGENSDEIFKATGKPINPRLFGSRRVEKRVERFVLRRADLVAAANKNYVEFAAANGADRGLTTVFPYGNRIHHQHFSEPQSRHGGERRLAAIGLGDRRFLLYIGRLVELKHPADVIKVLAELRARGQDIKTVLVGDGLQRQELVDLAQQLGVSDHVVFCGYQSQEWLAQVTPLATAVVSPITGAALVEAALAAAPIVAYDTDWQAEMIRTGETGELVPFLDWRAMADSVERLLSDPPYARALGRAVRAMALEMLDPKQLNQHERSQYDLLETRFSGAVECVK